MIEHEGIVEQIEGNFISVRILQKSACSDCHAKGYCTSADVREKSVKIRNNSGQFSLNEHVIIEGNTSTGYKAVLWAYIIPLIILVSAIIICTTVLHMPEVKAASISFLSLAPYYVILYLLRDKMAKKFIFSIKKTDPTNYSIL